MTNPKIIILSDLMQSRARKERELAYYQDELKKLEERMHWLKLEIRLTNDIIDMIEKEKIIDIRNWIDKTN